MFAALVGLFAVFYEGIHSQTRNILAEVDEQNKRLNETMKDFNKEMAFQPLSPEGLPIGLQMVGLWMEDAALLSWARRIEGLIDQ